MFSNHLPIIWCFHASARLVSPRAPMGPGRLHRRSHLRRDRRDRGDRRDRWHGGQMGPGEAEPWSPMEYGWTMVNDG